MTKTQRLQFEKLNVAFLNKERVELLDDQLLAYTLSFVDNFSMFMWPYFLRQDQMSDEMQVDHRIMAHDSVTTMLLDRRLRRDRYFQTELVIMHPGAEPWPGEHRHPHVDSIEVEVYDCMNCTRNGQVVEFPDIVYCGQSRLVHLLPTDFHSAPFKPKGSALLSCQSWNDVPPTSVGLDWIGEPVSLAHAKQQQAEAEASWSK